MTPRELLQEQGAVILIAPQGSGKTRHAETLKQMFGCATVIEEWDGISELPPRALALAHALPKALDARETATVLAALRSWQGRTFKDQRYTRIASDDGQHVPLSSTEIDTLCERLNA